MCRASIHHVGVFLLPPLFRLDDSHIVYPGIPHPDFGSASDLRSFLAKLAHYGIRTLSEWDLAYFTTDSDWYNYDGSASSQSFGSLFGSPISGVLFGLMFATPNVLRLDALYPCLVSSYTAVAVAESLRIHRMVIPPYTELPLTLGNLVIVAVFAIAIGLLARLFLYLLELFRREVPRIYGSKVLSAVLPALTITIAFLFIYALTGNFMYNGLSVDILYRAIDGRGIPLYAFIIKAVLVFMSIAAGFAGGEVVPLLVTGGAFGYTFSSILGLETAPFAVLGAIGMLTGGTNLPIVCFFLALELFGYSEPALLFLTVAFSSLHQGTRESITISASR